MIRNDARYSPGYCSSKTLPIILWNDGAEYFYVQDAVRDTQPTVCRRKTAHGKTI